MFEKHSIIIEEYLLLLYQLRGAGERLKVALAQGLKSSAPSQKHQVISCADVMSSMTLQQEEQQAILPFHIANKIHVVQVED